ncbi:ABC transporter permease [Nocardioides sp. AN3]
MLQRLNFIPGRLVQAIPVVFGVTILVFFLSQLLPGNPAVAILGDKATPERLAALNHQLGLDKPVWQQYLSYLGRLLHGNLGDSIMYQLPVSGLVMKALPVTLLLVGYAIALALLISVPLASLAASRPNGGRDLGVRGFTLLGQGMPQMWVGIMLILLFALHFRAFPVGGYGSGIDLIRVLFLPALTLAIALTPTLIRSLRASMMTVLDADFIATARSKGSGGLALYRGHVVRNAFLPAISVIGVNLSYLVGGSIIIEKVFALPGLGSLMMGAVFARDFPLIQGVTLFVGLMVVIVGILTDVVYALLDPRVNLGRGN